ncbi:uncharacterized protein [Haliotis cracherodii]|uniref:uncharacterized protein n=1 Tax=Haliotis cracherodii TaxID=6455 RepID=UPI0039E7E136
MKTTMATYTSLKIHKGFGLIIVFALIAVFMNNLQDRRISMFTRERMSGIGYVKTQPNDHNVNMFVDATNKDQARDTSLMYHGEHKTGVRSTNTNEDGSNTEDEKYEKWRQFKQVTADGGLQIHSAIYMYSAEEGPMIDVLVAAMDGYLTSTYTCVVTFMTGEIVHTGGVFSPMKMLLNVVGHQTGFVKCPLSIQYPELKSVSLRVDDMPTLPHNLEVRYPTHSQ